MPSHQIFILHPTPHLFTDIAPARLTAFLVEELVAYAQHEVPDLERCMGLGQQAMLLNATDIEPSLLAMLEPEPPPSRYDAAAMFLAGFCWGRAAVSPQLVLALLRGLDRHEDSWGVREMLMMALAVGCNGIRERALQQRVRER